MKLLLVRHGQSVWNAGRRFQGAADVPLSDLGRAQAEALGRALRGYRLAAAYVSPLRRALETASIALAGADVPIRPLPQLRELSLGEWEGCTVDEIRSRDGDPYRAWVRAPLDCPPPGGEPLDVVCGRVLEAMEEIAAAHPNGDEVLVVAHGGVISVYACHLLGCSFNDLWRLRVDNASLTVVKPPRLVSVNDTAHLGPLATRLMAVPGPRGHHGSVNGSSTASELAATSARGEEARGGARSRGEWGSEPSDLGPSAAPSPRARASEPDSSPRTPMP